MASHLFKLSGLSVAGSFKGDMVDVTLHAVGDEARQFACFPFGDAILRFKVSAAEADKLRLGQEYTLSLSPKVD